MKTKKQELSHNRALNKKSLLHYDIGVAYTKYKKEKINKNHWIKGRQNLLDFTSEYFKIIAENLVEKKGGVLIKKLGYFCVWRIPKKMTYSYNNEELYNHHTGNYVYNLIFLPRTKKKGYNFFSFERAFNNSLKQGVKEKLKRGFRYKNFMYSISRLIKK